jgi:alkylation response protein AidB-like acyl-CoA dehydrogenase
MQADMQADMQAVLHADPHSLTELQRFRAGLRRWLADNAQALTPSVEDHASVDRELAHQRKVQSLLYDAGWMLAGWPVEVGGLGGSPLLRAVLGEELTSRALVHTTSWSMHEVLGPAVVAYGHPDLAADLLPRLLAGQEFWCQGFSEPEAGSDLGSLRTTARPSGTNWVISGEKLWTSWGHHATRCVVLARTGAVGSGSRGISAFLVDMATPGITARPLQTMADVDEFSATSFVDVIVPAARLLGEVGQGWSVAQHILACERGPIFWQRGAWLMGQLSRVLPMAQERQADALLGEAYQALWAFRARSLSTQRGMASGRLPGAAASVDKILVAAAEQIAMDAARELLGGALETDDSLVGRGWRREWAYSRAASIYGGTSEIQKDIVSAQLLGLPRGT